MWSSLVIILLSPSSTWVLCTPTGFLTETPCGIETHTDFSDQCFAANSYVLLGSRLWIWRLSIKRMSVTRSSPDPRDGTSGCILAWVSLASETRARSRSAWWRGEEPCSHGSECVGAADTELLEIWARKGSAGWGQSDCGRHTEFFSASG